MVDHSGFRRNAGDNVARLADHRKYDPKNSPSDPHNSAAEMLILGHILDDKLWL